MTAGLNFNTPINKKLNGFASVTYSPDSKLSSLNSRNIATIQYSSSGAEILVEPLDVDVLVKIKNGCLVLKLLFKKVAAWGTDLMI